MKNTVTIMDIANSLGLSRNTVSKALNGRPVPAKTRSAVIAAAIELGYKGCGLAAAAAGELRGHRRFLILSSRLLMNMSYYVYVLRGLEERLSSVDAELIQFHVTSPASFDKVRRYLEENGADGILCIEFFHAQYISELARLGLPLVFVDFPASPPPVRGRYDIILPESQYVVRDFCLQKIREGRRELGFAGDYMHCRSFYERFIGMKEAVFLSGEELDLNMSILHTDSASYGTRRLTELIGTMEKLPRMFVAANDFIALNLIDALKSLGVRVPEDTAVLGFDNLVEAKRYDPQLTTVNVNKVALGRRTAALLLDRVASPAGPNQTVYMASSLIVRGSA